MAEVIGLAASVIAVIQIAGSVADACISYIDSVRDYPKDLRLVYVETSSLKTVFESLRFLDTADADDSKVLQVLHAQDGPVQSCKKAISELSRLLPPAPSPASSLPSPGETKRKWLDNALTALAWPLKANRARKLLDEIKHHKSSISLALTGELLQEVKTIKKTLDTVNQTLTDPSPNHHAAQALYEEGTASWVLRSQDWNDWINRASRALWVHGIPGAGKTVLASYLIEEVTRLCGRRSANDRTVCVYYYCYHGHNQDESGPFLSWLLSQLLRRLGNIPSSAHDIYSSGGQPSVSSLWWLLADALSYFDKVFVVIDAIDESQHRENILDTLHQLITGKEFENMQILGTSRDYFDIRKVMSPISRPLSLSNSLVEADIKLYVSARIASNSGFRRWPPGLRAEVEEALSTGAQGMFRWAVCQLDLIRRLGHPDKIRTALKNLPETLDDTYERIFSYIVRDDRPLVRHVLRWICFHNKLWGTELSLAASTLLDTYFLEADEGKSGDLHCYDIDLLKETCGCLVTFAMDEDLQLESAVLAHYTVREFLESDRLQKHSSFFQLEPGDRYTDYLNNIFKHAMGSESLRRLELPFLVYRMGLDGYSLSSSFRALTVLEGDVDASLVMRFLDSNSPHYSSLSIGFDGDILLNDTAESVPRPDRLRGRYLADFDLVDPSKVDVGFGDVLWDTLQTSSMPAAGFLMLMKLECYVLADHCLRRFGIKAVLEAEFVVVTERPSAYIPREYKLWTFSGTVMEYFTNYTVDLRGDEDFRFCCDRGLGHADFSNILPFYASVHIYCEECYPDDSDADKPCILKTLLRHGVHIQPPNYEITPLQILSANSDLAGVRILLGAGADPNSVGDKHGVSWGVDSMLCGFRSLRGLSPLRILKTVPNAPVLRASGGLQAKDVESLLLEYGAEDFSLKEEETPSQTDIKDK